MAIVSSIAFLLRATIGATPERLSNRCATPRARSARARFVVAVVAVAGVLLTAELASAQADDRQSTASGGNRATSFATFLGGGALGLAAHESGHLLFDGIFDAHARLESVSFHGVPFFAITHDSGLSPRREFVIDSAGFWVQQAGNEILLTRRPDLRHEHAPLEKGMFAFNVLASVAYAGAAFARTGPVERDTRGMADSLRWKEPLIGAIVLAPALLDAVRFFYPQARWATWGSRGAKAGMVLLVFR
jgi:hypothetical protein